MIQINDKEFFNLYSEVMKVIKRNDVVENVEEIEMKPQVKIVNSADPFFGQILNVIESVDEIGIEGVIVDIPNGDKWFYTIDEVEIVKTV